MSSQNRRALKTIFFGTPEFSLPTLEYCFQHTTLGGIVSQPDRPRGRGHKLSPSPCKQFALDHDIPVWTPSSLKKESDELQKFLEFQSTFGADVFVVIAYGNLLPQKILDLPRIAPVNLHASLLPQWRGAAPIQRALEAGDTLTGVALQRMVFDLDAGDVLHERQLHILPTDNAMTLTEKLSLLARDTLKDYLESSSPTFVGQPQDRSRVSIARKIEKSEGVVSGLWSAELCMRRLRAFAIWPGVKTRLEALGEFKIIQGRVLPCLWSDAVPTLQLTKHESPSETQCGLFEVTDSSRHRFFALSFMDGSLLRLDEIQLPGKGPVAATQVIARALASSHT